MWLRFLFCFVCFTTSAWAEDAASFFSTKENIQSEANLMEFKGRKILLVDDTQAQGLYVPVLQRLKALEGKEFHPNLIKQSLLWYFENQGDNFLGIRVEKKQSGVVLFLSFREKQKISAIEFRGNAAINTTALETLFELRTNSDYDRVQVEAGIQKLVTHYQTFGYLNAEIKSEFTNDKKLVLTISEGAPTTIVGVGVSPLSVIEDKVLRARYEREILQLFGLKSGDRIERAKALNGLQNIRDWLREHDFLTAKDPVLDYRIAEENRVFVNINIDYGSRIRFGFRGNVNYSYRELMSVVGEVKEVSGGTDYLDAVKRKISETYRAAGYVNISINTLTREDPEKGIRYISLILDEGKKVPITSLRLEGVFSLTEKEAKEKFYSLAPRIVQRNFFHEEGINKAGELLAEYLRSLGYLSAKLEFTKFDFSKDREKVNVTLLFSEGAQTIVQDISIKGVRSIEENEILEMLGQEKDKPFNIFTFEQGLVKIKDRYQELGNLNAQILNEGTDSIVRYSRDNTQVSILVDIDEGPIYQVGDVIVRGNKKTHARVVLRELPFMTGDILTRPLLNEAEDNLRKLNLFGSVILRPVDRPGEDSVKDILILIEETEPGSIEVAPGYRNDLGLRLAVGAAYLNLGGWHRSVNGSVVFNRRTEDYRFPEYNASFGFREPYLANWPVVFTTNLNLLRRQFNSFDANVARLTTAVKRDLTSVTSVFLEHSYERTKIQNVKPPYTKATDEKTTFVGSLTPGIIFDTRNNRFNPTSGFQSINRFEWATNYFGSQDSIGFIRTSSSNSFYLPLWDAASFAFAVNLGWSRSNIAGKEIPIFKLFRLGGIGSIRGYSDDSLQVETTKTINGTLGLINYRGEFRLPLSGSFGMALFADAGNLMVDRFAPFVVRSSAGAGLRYNTAVGPVVLDFAWRLQTSETVGDTVVKGADRYKVHFSIGSF